MKLRSITRGQCEERANKLAGMVDAQYSSKMAWLWRDRPGGNWYLSIKRGTKREFRSLKTRDGAEAERERDRVRAELASRPWPSGNIRWKKDEWQRFNTLRGKTRQSKQMYALAARAMAILTDTDRWGGC